MIDSKIKKCAVLYSGGTDSTLAAALTCREYDHIHLVTYHRFGFFSSENPGVNALKLIEKYPDKYITFKLINFDSLFTHISYEQYFKNLFKHGFFLLSTCGLCKLAMHIRTIIYCVDHKIENVCDGANKGMNLFPAQMAEIIEEIKNLYRIAEINYFTPVFDYESLPDTGFTDRLMLGNKSNEINDENREIIKKTTGYELYKMGITDSENIKGTREDKKMQPRCFQFILFNIFVHWYFLNKYSYHEYKTGTLAFYKDKIETFKKVLIDYINDPNASKLNRYIDKKETLLMDSLNKRVIDAAGCTNCRQGDLKN